MMSFRFFALVSALLLFSPAFVAAQQTAYPDITFEYTPFFDAPCSAITKQPIAPEAVEELRNRLNSFSEYWRQDAPKLLGTTVKVTGVEFQFRETKAALHLCRNFGSTSLPLLIEMTYFIKAIDGKRASPMLMFSNLVFHETLHRYVGDRIGTLPGKTTPLLTKYRDEPLPVRAHLHLYAIMNEVYRRLNRQKKSEAVIAFEQTLKSAPITKRAREIVDKEGAEAFLSEFRRNRKNAAR